MSIDPTDLHGQADAMRVIATDAVVAFQPQRERGRVRLHG